MASAPYNCQKRVNPNHLNLFGFLVRCVFAAESAIFTKLQLIWCCPLIFGRRIISVFAFSACKGNNNSHLKDSLVIYSIISLTTPAPTVRPPSRTANRTSFSMAIGVISCASIVTLSPGITISTPSGNVNIPVTSVVRK